MVAGVVKLDDVAFGIICFLPLMGEDASARGDDGECCGLPAFTVHFAGCVVMDGALLGFELCSSRGPQRPRGVSRFGQLEKFEPMIAAQAAYWMRDGRVPAARKNGSRLGIRSSRKLSMLFR